MNSTNTLCQWLLPVVQPARSFSTARSVKFWVFIRCENNRFRKKLMMKKFWNSHLTGQKLGYAASMKEKNFFEHPLVLFFKQFSLRSS